MPGCAGSAPILDRPLLLNQLGIEARSITGTKSAVEGTLSRFALRGEPLVTLILRNISERLAAEAKMRRLTNQSDYLREEVKHAFGEMVGNSRPMRRLISEITEVAGTDVSMLISGETGTGKELVGSSRTIKVEVMFED